MRPKKGSDRKETGMVFTKDNGEWLHPDSITRWLNNFSRDNGLPHIHPHAFRHTAASSMIANGVDLVTTAAELGHANANTTATIYAHQIAIARATAADVRAECLRGENSKIYGKTIFYEKVRFFPPLILSYPQTIPQSKFEANANLRKKLEKSRISYRNPG